MALRNRCLLRLFNTITNLSSRNIYSHNKNIYINNLFKSYIQGLSRRCRIVTKTCSSFILLGFGSSLLYSFRFAGLGPLDDSNSEGKSNSKRINFIADLVEKVAPAVVHIEIKDSHPLFGSNIITSNGSGFIVKDDGIILTNAHVVQNKRSVLVRLHDGRTFDGEVQFVDNSCDLATVKINAKNLPTLQLGKSSKIRTGEFVVAVGSPLSLSNTVTAGIVSSVDRGGQELGIHNDITYIQTDAVITVGNSGGPLVNMDGEAIGINNMKVTTGISFAIPSDYATDFLARVDKALKGRKSSWRAQSPNINAQQYVGLSMLTLTPSLILELKQRVPNFPDISSGVLVYKVFFGSPASKAGILPGDIISNVNGNQVTSARDIHGAIKSLAEFKVSVRRGLKTLQFTVHPEIIS